LREEDVLADIRAGRGNRFLPEAALPKDMTVTGDLNEAAKADALVTGGAGAGAARLCRSPAAPAETRPARGDLRQGIEQGSGKLVTEVAAERCRARRWPSCRVHPLRAMWRAAFPRP